MGRGIGQRPESPVTREGAEERRGKVQVIDTNFVRFRAVPIPGLVFNTCLSRYRADPSHADAYIGKAVGWGVVVKVQGSGVREPSPCMTWGEVA